MIHSPKKLFLILLGSLLILGILGRKWLVAVITPQPNNLGVTSDGQLAPCPSSPNCVSSQTEDADPEHKVAPISYQSPLSEAKEKLKSTLYQLNFDFALVEEQPHYLHITTRTDGFGFIDDTEFYFDESEQVIHVRAAARLGDSDLGANRERVEKIRQQFQETD